MTPPRHRALLAQWLQKYLDQRAAADAAQASQPSMRLPDYAARKRMILGDKVLPNMVMLGHEQERWRKSTLIPAFHISAFPAPSR